MIEKGHSRKTVPACLPNRDAASVPLHPRATATPRHRPAPGPEIVPKPRAASPPQSRPRLRFPSTFLLPASAATPAEPVRVHARLRTGYVQPRERPKPACGGTQGNLRLYSRPGKNRIDSAFPREVGGRCGVKDYSYSIPDRVFMRDEIPAVRRTPFTAPCPRRVICVEILVSSTAPRCRHRI